MSDSISVDTAGTMLQRNGEQEPGQLGVPRGLSETILMLVYWASGTAPPHLLGEPGGTGCRVIRRRKAQGLLDQPAVGQEGEGRTLLQVAGIGVSRTLQGISPDRRPLLPQSLGPEIGQFPHTNKSQMCPRDAQVASAPSVLEASHPQLCGFHPTMKPEAGPDSSPACVRRGSLGTVEVYGLCSNNSCCPTLHPVAMTVAADAR